MTYLYNPEIHAEMVNMEFIQCLFCDQRLQKPSIKHIPFCD